MNTLKLSSLIKPSELNELIQNKQKGLKILDCTYPTRRGSNIFKATRIKNALFLDIGNLKEKNSALTLPFPGPDIFKSYLKNLNIRKDDIIICYDTYGIYSSPRAWFIFKAYGFHNVSVLDGGLPYWSKTGNQNDTNAISDLEMKNYSYFEKEEYSENFDTLTYDESYLAKYEEITQSTGAEIVDTRPESYFNMDSIPNSKNIPFDIFTNKDGTLKSKDEIRNLFSNQEIDLNSNKKIISTCGIGLSACLAYFAAKEILNYQNLQMYNGSFEEYSINLSKI